MPRPCRERSGGNINAHAVFTNNWSTGGGYNVNGLNFDDRATRGGPGVYMEGGRGVWYYLNSDNRRVVSLEYFGSWFVDRHESTSRDLVTVTRSFGADAGASGATTLPTSATAFVSLIFIVHLR